MGQLRVSNELRKRVMMFRCLHRRSSFDLAEARPWERAGEGKEARGEIKRLSIPGISFRVRPPLCGCDQRSRQNLSINSSRCLVQK